MKRLMLGAVAATFCLSLAAAAQKSTESPAIEGELVKMVKGRVIRGLPVEKDCMVLSYIPDWSHGDVDNIGVANNDGGVRTLIEWPEIPSDEAKQLDRQFLLALYSRNTSSRAPAGAIQAYEIEIDWPERTSWKTQPRYASKSVAKSDFAEGNGWKLVDVTALVRAQAEAKRKSHGVMLRFEFENRSGAANDWSGYQFVSREGENEWKSRRPIMLVVEPVK